jgi:hypothetical protein
MAMIRDPASTNGEGNSRGRVLPRTILCGAAGYAGLWIALSVTGVPATTGCQTHQCDASFYNYFGGTMMDADTFVTNAWDAPWLSFGGDTTIRIWFPKDVATRQVKSVLGYVGNDATPNGGPDFVGGDSFAPAVGQLAIYNFLGTGLQTQEGQTVGGGFWASNTTCADYFARFEVDFYPADAGVESSADAVAVSGGDASFDADASLVPEADASSEADALPEADAGAE